MSAIFFLADHPGWSYADLMATPDRIVEGLAMLDAEKARQVEK